MPADAAKRLSEEAAKYLFEHIYLTAANPHLTPVEQVPKLRQILEQAVKEVLADQLDLFGSLHERCVYIVDKYRVPDAIREGMHYVRKLGNDTIHSFGFKPTQDEYKRALKALTETVAFLAGTAPPSAITTFYTDAPLIATAPNRAPTSYETLARVRATVLKVTMPEETANGGQRASIFCAVEIPGDLDVITIMLWDEFAALAPLVWQYATIHCFNLKHVPEHPGMYSTTAESLVVLEPDLLVDVTDIAECEQARGSNPNIALLNKFVRSEPNEAMILGNMINAFFDDLLRDNRTPFEEAFRSAARQNILPIISAGGDDVEDLLQSLEIKARDQFGVIRAIVAQLEGQVVVTEPTFLSALYGLRGRLDVLIDAGQDGSTKDIIEVKSGRPPANGLWVNNEAQLALYELLLSSTFPNRRGKSSILYSRAPMQDQPLRSAQPNPWLKRRVLMTRNRIVATERKLVMRDFSPIYQINDDEFGLRPNYLDEAILQFEQRFGKLNAMERAYFLAYTAFIAREQWTAQFGSETDDDDFGFSGLWQQEINSKRRAYCILAPLTLDLHTSDPGEQRYTFNITGELGASNFREGDIAVLYPLEEDGSARPLQHQILKCTINALTPYQVTVTLRSRQLRLADLQVHKLWALEHDYLDTNFDTMYSSLYDFINAKAERRALLLGQRAPRVGAAPILRLDYKRQLTETQKTLLQKALSAQDYFLLQGPPGTGKTSQMVRELVRHLLLSEERDEAIVVLAFTNRAVSELFDAVVNAIGALPPNVLPTDPPFIVLGGQDDPKLHPYQLRELAKRETIIQLAEKLRRTRVIISTVASFLTNRDLLAFKTFSTAIVDEASQLLEPHLIGILSKVDRFILIGDEKQLPAVVTQKPADTVVDDPALTAIPLHDLRVSLFERLLGQCKANGWHDCYGMLIEQARMHVKVAEFANTEFYGGRLRPLRPDQEAALARFDPRSDNPHERVLAKGRVVFVHCPKDADGQPKVSRFEARQAARFVHTIADCYGGEFNARTVGVITPYRAQIAEIRRHLREDLRELVTVDTVERYQGSERDIIIVSFAVRQLQQLEFLQALTLDGKVDRKLNVALTRAREQLILLGNGTTLQRGKFMRALLIHVDRAGGLMMEAPPL